MCNKEKWVPWNPNNIFTKDHYLASCPNGFTEAGLVFTVYNNKNEKLEIIINCRIEFFSFTDEGSRDFDMEDTKTGVRFFEIINSNLIRSFHENPKLGLSWEPSEVKHFLFANNEGFFDIICHQDPKIRM